MREETLRDVLLGKPSAEALNQEAADATASLGTRIGIRVASIGSGEHVVTTEQLTRLCDAVHEGRIDPAKLEAIAFALIASDFFLWDRENPDGERVGKVLDDWSGTEIGYPLHPANIAKARHYLVTGENTFTPADLVRRQASP